MPDEREKTQQEDKWNISDGDYQRNRNISNSQILTKRRKRILRLSVILIIFLLAVAAVSYFLIKNIFIHH